MILSRTLLGLMSEAILLCVSRRIGVARRRAICGGARVGFMLIGSSSFPFVLAVCVDGLVLRFLILVLVSAEESAQGTSPDVLLGYQWRVGWMIRSVCEEFA